MFMRTTLFVICALSVASPGVLAESGVPTLRTTAGSDQPVDALRGAGLDGLASGAPAALDLARIPTQSAAPAAPAASGKSATPAAPAAAPAPPPIDLSALWYFASRKDFGRTAAEIKLIRKTHPDWSPPADLFSAAEGGGPEEQPLWDLFAKGDYDGIHARIAEMQKERPDWSPSADLRGKLALAEARAQLMKAHDAGDWPTVVTVATANKMLLTCKDPESLWRTAEALGRSGDQKRAFDSYRFTLTTCTSPHDRLATVQKAGTVLQSAADYDKLLALGRRQANGAGEFDGLRLDRVRRSIGEAIGDRSLPAPAQEDLDALAAAAKAPNDLADAQLLGWYYHSRKDDAAAVPWFEQVLDAGPDAKAAEGLTMSLRGKNDMVGARAAAVRYASLGDDNRKLLIDILDTVIADPSSTPLTSDEVTALSAAVDEEKSQEGAQALALLADRQKDAAAVKQWTDKELQWKGEEIDAAKSAEGAEALGWQIYATGDLAGAETWFQKSADWAPSEAAALGLVLTAHRLKHTKDYEARVAQYRTMFPRIAELDKSMRASVPKQGKKRVRLAVYRAPIHARNDGGWDQSAKDIMQTFHNGDYQKALALLDQRRAKRGEPRGLTLVRGWALYHSGQWDGAKQIFTNIDNGRYSDQREEGLRVLEYSLTPLRMR